MMDLITNSQAIIPNMTMPFQGINGTPPYVYSVVAGGIGGTIDPSTGLYTAPTNLGTDTIEVTDSLAATAQLSILVATPLGLFCDIIQKYMGLASDQVWIWDQKVDIPNDSRLYVTPRVLSEKPFANTNAYKITNDDFQSEQSVNIQAILDVHIRSRGPEARLRKEELLLALNSDYAQSQQETNSFFIGKLSRNFTDLSEIDGAAIPYHFSIMVALQYFVAKSSQVPYFDTFQAASVTTEP